MDSSTSFSGAQMLNQYSSSWKMLRTAIRNSDESVWSYSRKKWFFALTLYHIIETMDFYSRSTPNSMEWGKRAGYNWDDVKDPSTDILPLLSPQLLSNYLMDMIDRITSILISMNDESFYSKDGFHWFDSVFHKYLYLLRHNQHHLGEIAFVLRATSNVVMKWT
ncbi:MAG: DinB family protein [Candidatus Thorarchaeota archaeon]|nr:DinB family protein [Candidatus Thorarchaeota archaeon]